MYILKKGIQLLLVAVVAAGLAGCKKDDAAPTVNGNIKTIEYITISSAGVESRSIYYNTYDSQNRMVETLQKDGTGAPIDKTTTTFSNNTVTIKIYAADLTTVTNTRQFELNEKGYVKTWIGHEGTSYEYDDEGHLIRRVSAGNSVDEFTYVNGNLVSTQYTMAGTVVNYFTYTYTDVVDLRNFGQDYLGKGSKNIYASSNNMDNVITIPTYRFDDKGRIVSRIQNAGGSVLISNYTYFD